jgi:hypothetical protein
MKIKSVKLARSIWLFDLQDLNPTGKDVAEELFEWIKSAYDFSVAPDLSALAQAVSTGAVFERGHFQVRADVFIEISKLTVHNDGIVIDTPSSTTDGDRFAQDLLESATREFSLSYDEETVRRRMYLSELIVRSGASLDLVNPQLVAFAKQVSEAFSDTLKPEFHVGSLQFWSEPNDVGKHKQFTLERQASKTSAEGRYFSQAPFQTEQHFKLLQELEQIMMGS